jgi:phospholipase C
MSGARGPTLALLVTLAACGGGPSLTSGRITPVAHALPATSPSSKIKHVVIIFQENRSTDDLFNGFPGADTVKSGMNSKGQVVQLQPVSLSAPYDIGHKHSDFNLEYDGGKVDGFDKDSSNCVGAIVCIPRGERAYGYVPHDESKPYFTMAAEYTFGDEMFQTNQGPSFPAHQYILSGTSTVTNGSSLRAADNPLNPQGGRVGGCDSAPGSLVPAIDASGKLSENVYPCFKRLSLMELIDGASLTWRYYQQNRGPGLWNAPDAIFHIRTSHEYATDVETPSSKVLSDVAAGKLADVVWVTPSGLESDHARATNGSGPSWVAAIVNAIGESQYWGDTAIFVTWDDWGGWYDHVPPPQYNSYELGFRVPLIVISPYAKTHYVSHVQHEFASILKFTEETFGLPSLHTTDERADDLSDCFDFSQPPTKFKRISAKFPPSYFLHLRGPAGMPDDY